jgi:signal transduction histidine kinase
MAEPEMDFLKMGQEQLDLESSQILLGVALQFGATLDLDRLLPVVVRCMAELVNAERAVCALYDERGRVQRAVGHNIQWDGPDTPLPVSQGVVTEVLQKRKPVVLSDAVTDAVFRSRESIRALALRLIIGVPIEIHDKVAGILYVDSRAQGFPEIDRKTVLLTALGRLVGTAIENAQLFEEQRFRNRLLAEMAHEFRAPLAVIASNTWLLNQRASRGAVDPAEATRATAAINASSKRMLRMMDGTLELCRIDAAVEQPAPERVDLVALVQAHVTDLDVVAGRRNNVLHVKVAENLPPTETFPDRLGVVLDNLLFNALKHAYNDSVITVEVRARGDAGPEEARTRLVDDTAYLFRNVTPLKPAPESRFLEVSVHNPGDPIAEELLPRVFLAYVRGERRSEYSTGLGLSIVDQCIRHLGGLAWVESSAAEGTRFYFTVPCRIASALVQPAEAMTNAKSSR